MSNSPRSPAEENAAGIPARIDVSTGCSGLDDILGGGLSRHRLYLLEGAPGSGKTTLAFQFILDGVRHGERVLYVTLSETREEIVEVARSHQWSLDGIDILELTPDQATLETRDYTVFHPSEVELGATTKDVIQAVDQHGPTRIVIDSLSEFRLLAGSALRFRRQILALKQYFAGRACTVLLLDDMTSEAQDLQVHSIAHGVIQLSQTTPAYGKQRRRLTIAKMRGRAFRGGFHDYEIRVGGLEAFPRLVAAEHRVVPHRSRLTSGRPELDHLIGGGIAHGSSTLIVGAAGTGKSTIASLYAIAAADRGDKAVCFMFDEAATTLTRRMVSLGIDIDRHLHGGGLQLISVDPAELSPGEFTQQVRDKVVREGVSVVVIDSLNGYLHAMPEERFLITQLHELLSFLGKRGIITLLINAQTGLVGSTHNAVDASYLADAVILLRHFEDGGRIRLAISVVKNRHGAHERTIRELTLAPGKLVVGPPLSGYRGVLHGAPMRIGRTGRAPRADGSLTP